MDTIIRERGDCEPVEINLVARAPQPVPFTGETPVPQLFGYVMNLLRKPPRADCLRTGYQHGTTTH